MRKFAYLRRMEAILGPLKKRLGDEDFDRLVTDLQMHDDELEVWLDQYYNEFVAGGFPRNVIPYQSSGWKYLEITAADATDYSATAFDDSAWATGTAPFGSLRGTIHANLWTPYGGFATPWTIDTRIWLRRHAGTGLRSATINYRVDNTISAWWNGNLVINNVSPASVTTEASVAVPEGYLGGTNVLAVRATDDGFAAEDTAFIDVRVSAT